MQIRNDRKIGITTALWNASFCGIITQKMLMFFVYFLFVKATLKTMHAILSYSEIIFFYFFPGYFWKTRLKSLWWHYRGPWESFVRDISESRLKVGIIDRWRLVHSSYQSLQSPLSTIYWRICQIKLFLILKITEWFL